MRIAAKVASRAKNIVANRGRSASIEIPEPPRFGSVLDRPSRPVPATQVAQPRAPMGKAPSVGDTVIPAKAAIADPGTSNADLLEALEHVAVAIEASKGFAPTETALLGDLCNQLANAQMLHRVTRFSAHQLASYQSVLKRFRAPNVTMKAEQLRTQAGRLRLDHYVMPNAAAGNQAVDGARLDASAKEWLAAVEAGHAADLPTQCRLAAELEGFKRDLLEGTTCNWHDFIKVVCMIPEMLRHIKERNTWFIQLHKDILDVVTNPSASADEVDAVLREITKFQVRAVQSQLDGNEQRVKFKFVSTERRLYNVGFNNWTQGISANLEYSAYRVAVTNPDEVTVCLLNAQVDSFNPGDETDLLDDGAITYSADTWVYTAPGDEPPAPVVQQPRPAPETKQPAADA